MPYYEFLSAVRLTAALSPGMQERKGGAILATPEA
jgi:hypothetical protein